MKINALSVGKMLATLGSDDQKLAVQFSRELSARAGVAKVSGAGTSSPTARSLAAKKRWAKRKKEMARVAAVTATPTKKKGKGGNGTKSVSNVEVAETASA